VSSLIEDTIHAPATQLRNYRRRRAERRWRDRGILGETEAAIRHKIRIGAIPVKYVGASIRGSKSVLRSAYGSPGATA